MREIKFRAWEFSIKKMIPFNDIKPLKYVYDGDMDEMFEGMENHLILMQYTGLKDKNGVEIYEGDIVDSFGDVRQVVYQAPSFVMKKKEHHKSWMEFIKSPIENQLVEIIGNIYENKELLNAR